ncbi:MAG: hypothetical protein IJ071_05820 [Ruminococcus sp.]|nr:hypothetical protein [Ruminococcus sp.]
MKGKKMKKLTMILALLLLTGCGSTKDSPESSKPVEITTSESEAPIEEAPTEAETLPEAEPEDLPLPVEDETGAVYNTEMKFWVTEEGVEYLKDGQTVQLLSADTSSLLLYSDPESVLVEDDFDFDLYADLFVQTSFSPYNRLGVYFRYDPEKGLFEEWPELSQISFYTQPNDAAGTLTVHEKGSAVDYEDRVYQWEEGQPVLVSIDRQYASGSEILLDHFTVTDGAEELYMRERLVQDENGELITEEIPLG